MKLKSEAFEHNQKIPLKYTGEGEDVSPPLVIDDIPDQAATLAIIVDDPDAPMGTFDHWIAWNISANMSEFPEGYIAAHEGTNHFQELHYRGPMPPPGSPHRYFFKLYALDSSLELPEGATKEELEKAMQGHIIAKSELIGIYER